MKTPSLPQIDPKDLAYYAVAKQGIIDHLKLQKLLFYIDAWHMAFFDQPIIEEEFHAWVHGPVLTSVWHALKDASKLNAPMALPPKARERIIKRVESNLKKGQLELIGDVLEEYGSKTGYHLECLTHAEKPWIQARGNLRPDEKGSPKISKKTTREFYLSKLNQHG